jgi:proton glutamate symport protein
MIVVPLIIGAIISGITSISSTESFGRMSAKTFIYYISTTLIAVTTGLFFVNLIKPGSGSKFPSAVNCRKTSIRMPGSWWKP